MRKLIYLTGDIESPFFTNEIAAFVEEYDEVFVVGYSGNTSVCNQMSEQMGFKYSLISNTSFGLSGLSSFVTWLNEKHVKEEIHRIKGISSSAIKKFLYVCFYGIYWIKLNKILKDYINDSDEYYVYSFWLSRPGFGTASLAFNYDNIARAVSRTHRYDLYEEENSLGYLPFRKFIAENIDCIYFSSKDTLLYFKEKEYSKTKLPTFKLSYLGTYDHGIKKEKQNKSRIVIASCSYIIQRKRLDLIIRLIKEISDLAEVSWIHIGNGEAEQQIAAYAKSELENNKRIDYSFLGKMTDEDIFRTYHENDVDYFVNLSDSEGIPVSIIEAMSMGIPVIARNVGGISDAVDNSNGLLICDEEKNINWRIIAKKIVDIYHSEDYSLKSKNARQKWNDRFNGDSNPKRIATDIISDDRLETV